jgi:PAS domain S-box-containing protein
MGDGAMLTEDLTTFCNALLDPVAIVHSDGRLVLTNPALRNLLGYDAQETDRLDLQTIMPGHRQGEQTQRMQACLQGERVVAVPTELDTRNAGPIPVLMTLSPFRTREGHHRLVALLFKKMTTAQFSLERMNRFLKGRAGSRDAALDQTVNALQAEVAERRGVENELQLSRRQLRLLSQKTLELLENDRQVIAKELHDSIGASLAAIKFSLEGWLEVYGDQLPSPEIPFERIITHIVETIKETKRISANLRPSTLDDLGLLATARWFCRDLAGLYADIRITPCFEVDEADIPEAYKIVFYRVMQEALNNAAKHSGAQEIQVNIKRSGDYLEMSVNDDGCGFDLEQVMGSENALSGFGINSMRERIEICNGSFDIRTREGEGTRIRAFLQAAENPVEDLI